MPQIDFEPLSEPTSKVDFEPLDQSTKASRIDFQPLEESKPPQSPTPASDKALSETPVSPAPAFLTPQQMDVADQKMIAPYLADAATGVAQGVKEMVPKSMSAAAKMLFYTPIEETPHAIKEAYDVIRGVPIEQAVPESQTYKGFTQKPLTEQAKIVTGQVLPLALGLTGLRESLRPKIGEPSASEIPSPESVPQPEIRPSVGEEAPLRQQGETAGTQEPIVAQPPQETPQPVIRTHAGQEVGLNLPIRNPSENVTDTLRSYSTTPAGARIENANIDELSGGIYGEVGDVSKVNEIVKSMKSNEGYIARPIVDSSGNVVEGQHRLEALRKLGVSNVPIVRIFGAEDFIPNVEQLKSVIKSNGIKHSDQVNQMISHIGEILMDERGRTNDLRDYEPPQGFERAWNAAINEVVKQKPPVPEAGQAATVAGEKPTVGADVGAVPTGIANKYLDEVYGDGSPAVVAGKGPKEWKALGQARLDDFQATGNPVNDPYAVLTALREGKVPVAKLPHDVSLLRAEHQRLVEDARNSEGSPQYPQKAQAAFDMATAIKQVAHGPASDVFRSLQEHDAPRYDNVTDFDQATRDRLKREATPEEKTHFQRIAKDVRTTADAAGKEVEIAQKQVQKYRGKEKMSFDDAAKSIHDQISQLVKDCGL